MRWRQENPVIVSLHMFSNEKQVSLKNQTQQQFVTSYKIFIFRPLPLLLATQNTSVLHKVDRLEKRNNMVFTKKMLTLMFYEKITTLEKFAIFHDLPLLVYFFQCFNFFNINAWSWNCLTITT
jgi:hypothetical protein